MEITLVVATGLGGEIGGNGDLLWRLPRDMAFFKSFTIGHHVLMGRKTYESIPERFRPLPGRINLVLSSSASSWPGARTVASIDEAIEVTLKAGETDLMVIGGGSVYRQALPHASRVMLTRVHGHFDQADTFFPKLDEHWQVVKTEHYAADEKNPYDLDFLLYQKNK
ncbi:MAG: dihydrofolate reductase [Chitinophagales bacterium]